MANKFVDEANLAYYNQKVAKRIKLASPLDDMISLNSIDGRAETTLCQNGGIVVHAIYGKSIQYGTPSVDTPQPIYNVGGSGSFSLISSQDGSIENISTISFTSELRGIPVDPYDTTAEITYTDIDATSWVCDSIQLMEETKKWAYVHRIGVIHSYNGETIQGEFISSTGELSTGAEVLYILDTPIVSDLSDEDNKSMKHFRSFRDKTVIVGTGNELYPKPEFDVTITTEVSDWVNSIDERIVEIIKSLNANTDRRINRTLYAGETIMLIEDDYITKDSIIDVYTDKLGLNPKSIKIRLNKSISYLTTLEKGQTSIIFEDEAISETSVVDIYTNRVGVFPSSVKIMDGAVTILFEEQAEDIQVKVYLNDVAVESSTITFEFPPQTESARVKVYIKKFVSGIIMDQVLTAGSTEIEFYNPEFDDDAVIDIYTNEFNIVPKSMEVQANTLKLTFDPQPMDVNVRVVIS